MGINSTIMYGISMGEYALLGARYVVTKLVLPYALVYDNPARQQGWMSEYGHHLLF